MNQHLEYLAVSVDMIDRRIVLSGWQRSGDGTPVEMAAIHQAVGDLIANDPEDGVLKKDDRTTAVLPGGYKTGGPLRLQLLALRDENARSIQFQPGSPLAQVPVLEGHHTGEVTHVCLWPDGFAAQDWFGGVPRLSRLSEFLRIKLGIYIQFTPVFDHSLWSDLEDVQGQLRSIKLSLHPSLAQSDENYNGVFRTLLPANFDARVPVVDLNLKMGRKSPRSAYLPDHFDATIRRAAEVAPEILEDLVVRGRSRSTNEVRTINVHKNRIQQAVELQPSPVDPGRPDEVQAYSVIEEVVLEMRNSARLQEHVRPALHPLK